MATPQAAIKARRELKRAIQRADSLAARCLAQVCDGDLRLVDRETAEGRLRLALRAGKELDHAGLYSDGARGRCAQEAAQAEHEEDGDNDKEES